MNNPPREIRIDFESEYFNLVGPDHSDTIAWVRSIAERVEEQTIWRCSDVPTCTKRLYSTAQDGGKGEK